MDNQSFLPTHDMVQRVLLGLLNRNVTVKNATAKFLWSPSAQAVVGTYVRDDGSLWALWLCDLPLAGGASSALTLIPTDSLGSALKTGRLTQDMTDNLREVINVAASVFNQPDAPHIRLETIYMTPAQPPLPEKVVQMLLKPRRRLDLDVTVAGYGGGKMALFGL